MHTPESTCWTVIRAAAAGDSAGREELARRYLGVVRAYLDARWHGSLLRQDRDDAAQEVFIECFREEGALEAAGAGRVPSFRAFLYGVVRNVARRFESRAQPDALPLPEVEGDQSQSRLFERAWARAVMGRSWPRPPSGSASAPRPPRRPPCAGSSCCACASRRACPSAPSARAGPSTRRPCTTSTRRRARSSRRRCWRWWRSTTPARRRRSSRRPPSCCGRFPELPEI